jgi:hypothetical protein
MKGNSFKYCSEVDAARSTSLSGISSGPSPDVIVLGEV